MKPGIYKPIKCVVISGMAKTGTTLPLTLLDNHPELLVFPEELRFFHLECDNEDGRKAVERLFNNLNIQQLKQKNYYYDTDNYLKHGGAGFGKRDYSMLDFNKFEKNVREIFITHTNPADRFYGIISAFNDALGRPPLTNKSIFVCKAPHNELFITKWKKMLGQHGIYIIATRLPTEHYLSLKNIDKIQNKNLYNVHLYVNRVKIRLKLWKLFPKDRTLILDYDTLLNNTEKTLREIADLIQVNYDESLLTPTKMGIPWAGNSSRGIVKEQIFKNEHKAHKLLKTEEIALIETCLEKLYDKMGYTRLSSVDSLTKKMWYRLSVFIYRIKSLTFEKIISALKNTLSSFINH